MFLPPQESFQGYAPRVPVVVLIHSTSCKSFRLLLNPQSNLMQCAKFEAALLGIRLPHSWWLMTVGAKALHPWATPGLLGAASGGRLVLQLHGEGLVGGTPIVSHIPCCFYRVLKHS